MSVGLYPITDHATQALARLAQQYKGKPLIEGLISLLCTQIQEIEDAIWQMASERLLDNAIGAQLDRLGGILGQTRGAYTDEEYRLILRAKVLINRSSGTAEELIAIFSTVEPDATITVTDWPPACFELLLSDAISAADALMYRRFLTMARAGGVRGILRWYEVATTQRLTLSTHTSFTTSTSRGLSSTAAPTVGGHLGGARDD